MNNKALENMLNNEKYLSDYACKNKDAKRIEANIDDIRPNYFRDTDRIIHSLSYTRYIDKTQVFTSVDNDNISKRIIHVTLVSKIARTIGRALKLNEDLIEAIALGHDIGHAPLGHTGEKFLNNLSLKYNEGYFNHNVQSIRTLMVLEDKNLTIQTLDGILCHNGEIIEQNYAPKKKTYEEFIEDYNKTYKIKDYSKTLIPMTLEGCVVRISDVIAYIGRDIEDAIRLNIIKKEDIPDDIVNILGNTNTKIINTIIVDIINNSLEKPYIKISKDVFAAINKLKDFNYENIYNKSLTKEQNIFYENAFNELFEYYLNNIHNKECSINQIFLNNMNEEYNENTTDVRKVIDYIAGMTDIFFINEYKKIGI